MASETIAPAMLMLQRIKVLDDWYDDHHLYALRCRSTSYLDSQKTDRNLAAPPGIEDQRGEQMNEISRLPEVEETAVFHSRPPQARWPWVVVAGVALGGAWFGFSQREGGLVAQAAVPPAPVTVSRPLERDVDTQIGFLGQFSAVDRVELRAQVGGTLAEIHFEDGQIVGKGDLLFVIDPSPCEIRLAQATAQLGRRGVARLTLANSQLYRAQALKRTDFQDGRKR